MAFLGPAGTYGEQACRRLAALCGSPEAERRPQATIRAVVMALLEQRVDAAVVPVENSVEGGVTSCSDLLWQSCLLYTSPSPRDRLLSRMPSSA